MIEDGWVPNESAFVFGGVTHSPAETPFGTVQDAEQLYNWAVTEGNMPELYEALPKTRARLLNELVRERLDNGESPPPGAGYWVRCYISSRGTNSQANQPEVAEDE